MDVLVAAEGPATVVTPVGDIDAKTAPAFQEAALANVTEGGHVLIDLAGVPFMSSAGLRVLLLVYRQATSMKSPVTLCGLRPDVRASMSATGFLSFFTVYPDRKEALAALA